MRKEDRTENAFEVDLKKIRKYLELIEFYSKLIHGLYGTGNKIFQDAPWQNAIGQENIVGQLSDPRFSQEENLLGVPFLPLDQAAPYVPDTAAWDEEQWQNAQIQKKLEYAKQDRLRDEEYAKSDAKQANRKLQIQRQFDASPGEATRPDFSWQELMGKWR